MHAAEAPALAESLDEALSCLERLIAARDAEIQRLRAELAHKDLFVRELRAILRDHQVRFETWERRLRRIEAGLLPGEPAPTSPLLSSLSGSGKDTYRP
jgi:hypothetical protein